MSLGTTWNSEQRELSNSRRLGEAEARTRMARDGLYVTISGWASVTTRVCASMAARMCLGRLKECWCVWPSQ